MYLISLIKNDTREVNYIGYTFNENMAIDASKYYSKIYKKKGVIKLLKVTSDVYHAIEEEHRKFIPEIYEIKDGVYVNEYVYDACSDEIDRILDDTYTAAKNLKRFLSLYKDKDAKKCLKYLKRIIKKYHSTDDDNLILRIDQGKILNSINYEFNKDI